MYLNKYAPMIFVNEKTFLKYFILFSFAGLFLLLSLNIIVDPMSSFQTNIFKPLLESERTDKLQMLENFSSSPDILILGSSHVMKFNPKLIGNITNKTVFNFGVFSARTEDYYAILSFAVEDLNITPELIILGIDIEAFHDNLEIDARLIAEKRLYKKINNNYFYVSFQSVFKSINIWYFMDVLKVFKYSILGYPEKTYHFEDDGFLIYDKWERQKESGNFNLTFELEKSTPKVFYRFKDINKLDKTRKKYFEKFIKKAEENNISLIFFITTIHPETLNKLYEKTKYPDLYSELKNYLDELKLSYDFISYDFSTIENYNGCEECFYDAGHIDEKNVDLILKIWRDSDVI